jgi:hypothetical protein
LSRGRPRARNSLLDGSGVLVDNGNTPEPDGTA